MRIAELALQHFCTKASWRTPSGFACETSSASTTILAGVPDDEQAKIAGGNIARVYNFDVARLTVPA